MGSARFIQEYRLRGPYSNDEFITSNETTQDSYEPEAITPNHDTLTIDSHYSKTVYQDFTQRPSLSSFTEYDDTKRNLEKQIDFEYDDRNYSEDQMDIDVDEQVKKVKIKKELKKSGHFVSARGRMISKTVLYPERNKISPVKWSQGEKPLYEKGYLIGKYVK